VDDRAAEPFRIQPSLGDFFHFGRGVLVHGKDGGEPSREARVDIHEVPLDLVFVPRDDADELVPVLCEHPVQGIDGRFAEGVSVPAGPAVGEGRRFVQEEDAAERRFDERRRLAGSLSQKIGDHVLGAGVDDFGVLEVAEGVQDFGQDVGESGFADARTPVDDHVAEVGLGETFLDPVDNEVYELLLDFLETDHVLELEEVRQETRESVPVPERFADDGVVIVRWPFEFCHLRFRFAAELDEF
jgi:hypothetical protein